MSASPVPPAFTETVLNSGSCRSPRRSLRSSCRWRCNSTFPSASRIALAIFHQRSHKVNMYSSCPPYMCSSRSGRIHKHCIAPLARAARTYGQTWTRVSCNQYRARLPYTGIIWGDLYLSHVVTTVCHFISCDGAGWVNQNRVTFHMVYFSIDGLINYTNLSNYFSARACWVMFLFVTRTAGRIAGLSSVISSLPVLRTDFYYALPVGSCNPPCIHE